jgi:hypothetical protein
MGHRAAVHRQEVVLREVDTVTLSSPSGATIADGSGIGTITDDD